MAVDFDLSGPWGDGGSVASTPFYQDEWTQWAAAAMGDGIALEDGYDGYLAVTATGSSTIVTVAPSGGPGCFVVAGMWGRLTGNKTLDIDAGGAPGSGVRRLDYIVARARRDEGKLEVDVVPGTPGTGLLPTLNRDRLDDFESPIAVIDRTGPVNVAQSMITGTSYRPTPGYFAGVAAPKPGGGVPLGAILTQGYEQYARVLDSGVPAWRDLHNPAWTNFVLSSGITGLAQDPPRWRINHSVLEMAGVATKSSGAFAAGESTQIASVPSSLYSSMGFIFETPIVGMRATVSPISTVVPEPVVVTLDAGGGAVWAKPASTGRKLFSLSGIRIHPRP